MTAKDRYEKGIFITERIWDASLDWRIENLPLTKALRAAKNSLEQQPLDFEYAFQSFGEAVVGVDGNTHNGKERQYRTEFVTAFGQASLALGKAKHCAEVDEEAESDNQACSVLYWLMEFDNQFRILQYDSIEAEPEGFQGDWDYRGDDWWRVTNSSNTLVSIILQISGVTVEQYMRYRNALESFSMPRGSLQDILEYELNLQEGARFDDEFGGKLDE